MDCILPRKQRYHIISADDSITGGRSCSIKALYFGLAVLTLCALVALGGLWQAFQGHHVSESRLLQAIADLKG